jgi:sterol desaturase/sphingolipid hydroxylase (fatty acid hydroxylase superfamily)
LDHWLKSLLNRSPSPWRPICAYVPFMVAGVMHWWWIDGSLSTLSIALFSGISLWIIAEYLLHRFLFHFRTINVRIAKLVDELHAGHHREPFNLAIVVASLRHSIPFAMLNYVVLFLLLESWELAWLVNSGYGIGYLTYEIMHYNIHRHLKEKETWPRWAAFHLTHHFRGAKINFGITNTLVDRIFGTYGQCIYSIPNNMTDEHVKRTQILET